MSDIVRAALPSRGFMHVSMAGRLVLAGLLAAQVSPAVAGGSGFSFQSEVEEYSGGRTGQLSERPWWEQMGDPELSQLILEGLAANHDLQAALARVEQSESAAAVSLSSLLPSLSLDTSVNLAPAKSRVFMFGLGGDSSSDATGTSGDDTSSGADPFSLESDSSSTYVTGAITVNAGLAVDLWGRQYFQYRAARYDATASAGDWDAQATVLALRIAQAFHDAVVARARSVLIKEQIATNERLLELTELRFEGSEATGLDVLQQRQQLAAARTLLPQAQLAVRTGVLQLAVLLGRNPASPRLELPDTLPEVPAQAPVGAPSQLLELRPELRSALARYRSAEASLRSARRSLLPTLLLTGQAGQQAYYLSELDSQWFWGAGASVSMPLFGGGSISAGVRSARAAERAAFHSLYQQFLQAVQEVEGALALETAQRAQLDALEAQVEAAELALEAAQERYVRGLTGYLSVLTAVNGLHQAQLSALQTERQLIDARVQVFDALGGTWTGTWAGRK